jgi:hypothetical protein
VLGDVAAASNATQDVVVQSAVEYEAGPALAESSEAPLVEVKQKRSRPARARKKPVIDAIIEPPTPVIHVVVEDTAPAPKPRRRAASKKSAAVIEVIPVPEVVAEKVKPTPRARRKKKDEESE